MLARASILLGIGTSSMIASPLVVNVFDATTHERLACRAYLQNAEGEYLTFVSQQGEGTAVVYQRDRSGSREHHTTVSAHPFLADVPAGSYRLTLERGKEYSPKLVQIEHAGDSTHVTAYLRRWTSMADKGWYSGDTHVHRAVSELPNLVLAEDLNVALPLTYWVTEFTETPSQNSRPNPSVVPPATLIEVDREHVIWPINTEYEIFTVNRDRHTLGAVFILNHREAFDLRAHPVSRIAAEARRQGGLLDLDKHNWPWSMMLLPIMEVDLFELSNNHVWRTDFAFTNWYPEYLPDYLQFEGSKAGYTESDWLHWGFANYYALLNCGFDMMPSAGTASGVHPVPIGFGRVYVYLGDRFEFDRWMEGLGAGRSFVTTGPMLTAQFNGQLPGARFRTNGPSELQISGEASWYRPIQRVEIVVNGKVVETFEPSGASTNPEQASSLPFATSIPLETSSWATVRCFSETLEGRIRFAHTAPVHVSVAGRPLPVQVDEVRYLEKRVADELERHRGVLPGDALAEYEAALNFYRKKLESAE